MESNHRKNQYLLTYASVFGSVGKSKFNGTAELEDVILEMLNILWKAIGEYVINKNDRIPPIHPDHSHIIHTNYVPNFIQSSLLKTLFHIFQRFSIS
jgi:hypothetical protein